MNGKSIHILLIEDSEVHIALISDALRSRGERVQLTVARSLFEARACLAESVPDLAVIDWFLPDGKGVELVPTGKDKATFPVVMISAHGDENVAVQAMKAGALDYVVKSPATLADMPHIVDRALREWEHIIERKRAEEALVAANRQLRAEIANREKAEQERDRLFELSIDMFAVSEIDGSFKQVNPAWTKTLGWSEEELLGRPYIEFVHPDDHEATLAAAAQISADRNLHGFENRYRCKDGSYKWISWNAFSLPEENLTFAVARDITGQKRTELALQESEALFRSFFEYSAAGVVIVDTEGKALQVNPAFCRVSGYTSEECLEKNVYDMTHPAYWEETRRLYQELRSGKRQYSDIEKRYIRKDGTEIWVHTTVAGVYGNDGALLYCVALVQNIDERKRAEEDLRESEERFRATFEQAAVGIAHVAPDGHWMRVNQKLCDIVGYTREELLKGTFQDITHPDDLDADMEYVRQVLAGEIQAYSMEKRYIRKDGSLLWINLTVSLVREPWGAPKHFISVVEDITDRKQAEEDLIEANRELDAFVYTVSHDLRTPLTPIIGYADFLRTSCRDRLDEQALDCLAKISTSGGKMVALIEDLLILATVGQVERPAEPLDTGTVVNEAACDLSGELSGARVAVEVGDLPSLCVPKTLLTQIFHNLIGNAVNYASREGSPIEIGGERRGELVRLYVRDHGPGIPEEERGRIFDVFYRGATGNKSPGTGLGLATVQKITRIYGGRAWVEETEGGGSTFWVEMVDVPTATENEKDTP